MKKIIIGISLFALMACSNKKLDYADVIKYDWLRPFVIDSIGFSGKHNLDRGTLDFNLQTKNQNPFIYLDSIAFSKGWSVDAESKFRRIYTKNISLYDSDTKNDTLEIHYLRSDIKLNYRFY